MFLTDCALLGGFLLTVYNSYVFFINIPLGNGHPNQDTTSKRTGLSKLKTDILSIKMEKRFLCDKGYHAQSRKESKLSISLSPALSVLRPSDTGTITVPIL